jgi:uncharacterized protein DUF4253
MTDRPKEEEWRQKAIAAFPYQRIETAGELALVTWQQLRSAGRDSPVVLGADRDVALLMGMLDPADPTRRSAPEVLAAANGMPHPEGLAARLAEEDARARERMVEEFAGLAREALSKMFVPDATTGKLRQLTNEEVRAMMLAEPQSPPVGEWPGTVEPSPALSVATETLTRTPPAKVHIAVIPTDDWTTIPAHLNWGGWNACPHPEYHVAALRSWRDRFGAELVGLSFDTMNLRVARRPATREAALELAREQYLYCNDIVDQGTGTLSRLAACLTADDWWYFWWD